MVASWSPSLLSLPGAQSRGSGGPGMACGGQLLHVGETGLARWPGGSGVVSQQDQHGSQ